MIEPILPMLAVPAEPFDSPEYLFEVKWNGVRALGGRAQGSCCLWGRERADYCPRYPELQVLRQLPQDTVVDGELVLLPEGLPDLDAMLARHQLSNPVLIRQQSRSRPVSYVVFDVLYLKGRCLFGQPLAQRREVLHDLLEQVQQPRLALSQGVVGAGQALFTEAVAQGQEGVMGKHLASRYVPGRRCSSWRKIKPRRLLPCVIIGFVPGPQGVRGVYVAACVAGQLRYVAQLRTGMSSQVRAQLQEVLHGRVRSQPLVSCPQPGVWVQPEVYCQARFLEWTRAGRLRGASFAGLLPAAPCELALPSSPAVSGHAVRHS